MLCLLLEQASFFMESKFLFFWVNIILSFELTLFCFPDINLSLILSLVNIKLQFIPAFFTGLFCKDSALFLLITNFWKKSNWSVFNLISLIFCFCFSFSLFMEIFLDFSFKNLLLCLFTIFRFFLLSNELFFFGLLISKDRILIFFFLLINSNFFSGELTIKLNPRRFGFMAWLL